MHYMLLWKVPEACFVFPTAHHFCFGVWLSLFFSTGSPIFFVCCWLLFFWSDLNSSVPYCIAISKFSEFMKVIMYVQVRDCQCCSYLALLSFLICSSLLCNSSPLFFSPYLGVFLWLKMEECFCLVLVYLIVTMEILYTCESCSLFGICGVVFFCYFLWWNYLVAN